MKLIECYIENFGKLHQFSYQFQDGLNTISELNGWGKSTFASFIRAIFYGMQGSRTRKNLDDKERIKYKPWQGGQFGGYIIFELNDKKYKVERFFADKEKDDTFAVYDLSTGLKSNVFTEKIGEEIFKLDRDAYSRSTYIPQNTISIEMNDSISAKLSNLIENENDINNFDSAISLLGKSKKEYVKTGGRGKLDIITNRISSLKKDLDKCQSQGEALDSWNGKLEEIISEKKESKEKLQIIRNQIELASRYEGQAAKLQQYNTLCELEKNTNSDFEPLDIFFCNGIPSEQELIQNEAIASDILKKQGAIKSFELSEEELQNRERLKKYFSKGVPEENDICTCEKQITVYRENKIKLTANELTELEQQKKAEYDEFFKNGTPSDSEVDQYIDKISILNDLKVKISTQENQRDMFKNLQIPMNKTQEKKKTGIGKKILAVIMVLLGILFMALFVFIGLALIAAGVAIFVRSAKKSKQKNDVAKEACDVNNPQNRVSEIQNVIDELTLQRDHIEEEITSFLKRFSVDSNLNNTYTLLSDIKSKASEYRNIIIKFNNQENMILKDEQKNVLLQIDTFLEPYYDIKSFSIEQKDTLLKEVRKNKNEHFKLGEKESNYSNIKEELDALKKELFERLKPYFNEMDNNPSTNVNTLKEKRKEYIRLSGVLENCKLKKEQFEQENDVRALNNIKIPEYSLKELQNSESILNDKLETLSGEENNIRKNIITFSEAADKCPELQGEIELLEEEYNTGSEKLDILDKTLQCLEKAKEQFSTHYMDGMNQGFVNYVTMLDNGTLGETHIDVNLNVSISTYGSQKSLDYFSTGYKDLIGLCTRFALIDALFENEKPVIILDDPFVNLDGVKLKKVLAMINKISNKYQIIYFACHESRISTC